MVVMTSDSASRRYEIISCGEVSSADRSDAWVHRWQADQAICCTRVAGGQQQVGNGNGISATRTKVCFIRACRHKSLIEVDVLNSGDLHAPNAGLS